MDGTLPEIPLHEQNVNRGSSVRPTSVFQNGGGDVANADSFNDDMFSFQLRGPGVNWILHHRVFDTLSYT